MTAWGGRGDLLPVGRLFSVVRAVPATLGEGFVSGETLRLAFAGYSRYDESHVYSFETPEGTLKHFMLRDTEPVECLTTAFKAA